MLELLVNRSKRRRRRKKRDKALTGSEKVKLIDMRTGKKLGAAFVPMLQDLKVYLEENPDHNVMPDWSETVRGSGFLPESLFHRLLNDESEIPKRTRRRRHHNPPPVVPVERPLMGGDAEEEEDEEEEEEEETLVSDGAYMMEDEDLEDASHLVTSHHFLSPDYEMKMEGNDSLSQGGYESSASDREALPDDIMAGNDDTDSSSSSSED